MRLRVNTSSGEHGCYRVNPFFPHLFASPFASVLGLGLSTEGDVESGVDPSNAPPSLLLLRVRVLPHVRVRVRALKWGSSFPSPTPIAPEGEPRKRSALPDGGRSAPRSPRCGLWSCTRIYAYEDLWRRRGGMRMGPPRGWRACSMVGRTGSSVRRRMCNRREERAIGLWRPRRVSTML